MKKCPRRAGGRVKSPLLGALDHIMLRRTENVNNDVERAPCLKKTMQSVARDHPFLPASGAVETWNDVLAASASRLVSTPSVAHSHTT